MNPSFEDITLKHSSGAKCRLLAHGSHLCSWTTADQTERLFLSSKAEFTPNKAIRGGVPIIFPQFNAMGPGKRHGFARLLPWRISERTTDSLTMSLQSTASTQSIWPYTFVANFTVRLTDCRLIMQLSVHNTDSTPMQFTAALHSYFRIKDLLSTTVSGLSGLTYWDNDGSDFNTRSIQNEDQLNLLGELDRVYFQARRPLSLIENQQHILDIEMKGFSDCVIWNPGAVGASNMSDMNDSEWRSMLCIEAAAIDHPVALEPGQVWTGAQLITAANLQQETEDVI